MDDYSALAQRISVSVPEVRGCLLLSRDGMILGSYPEEDESLAKGPWLRFCALGEPEKSFVEFSDQVWAYVKRGAYASFAVADAGVRPGILLDQLDQALMTADEGRTRRDTLRVPDASAAPSGKPRTSLHPSAGKTQPEPTPEPVEVSVVADPPLTQAEADHGHWKRNVPADPAGPAGGSEAPPVVSETKPASDPIAAAPATPEAAPLAPGPETPGSALGKEPKKLAGGLGGVVEEETEVDRVLLAKEFSGLLQLDSGDDEVNP